MIWFFVLIIFMGIGIAIGWFLWGKPGAEKGIDLKSIEAPSWIEQDFIRKNIYSRPAVSLKQVDGIVIHYVANPGPQQSRTEIILTAWPIRKKMAHQPAPILL